MFVNPGTKARVTAPSPSLSQTRGERWSGDVIAADYVAGYTTGTPRLLTRKIGIRRGLASEGEGVVGCGGGDGGKGGWGASSRGRRRRRQVEGGGGERAVSGVRRLVSQEPTEGNCAWGRGGGGRRGGRLATDPQYWCARSRSPFACRLVSTHVEPEFLRGGGWDSMMGVLRLLSERIWFSKEFFFIDEEKERCV